MKRTPSAWRARRWSRRSATWQAHAGGPFRSRDRREGHAAARRLLAERMDGLLTATQTRQLAEHLLACTRCRSVARGYEESRELLAGLRPTVVPRDLGARVSAALDREMAGGPRRGHLPDTLSRPAAGIAGPIAAGAAAVVVLVVGARILFAPSAGLLSMPAGLGAATTPAPAPAATPFSVPVAELALVQQGADGLTVYQASVSEVCPADAVDCASTRYETSPVVGIPADLVPRGVAFDRANHRMALLAEDALGADTVSVVVLPPMEELPDPLGAGPGPDGRWRGPGAPPSMGIAASPAPTASGGPADAPARVLAILEGVEAVGASPAWSPDGQMLAFSAMPADHSRGPDIYLWRPGQDHARRLTADHGSWFASWSGERIVISRLPKGEGRDLADTVLVDPADGREQDVRLAGAWLPSVDPSGRFAVSWRGTLTGGIAQVRPRTGGLALVDWQLVDPAASGAGAPLAMAAPAARGSGTARDRSAAKSPSAWLESIEAGTDETPAALDWQVSWASSDTTFGYWVADARGASWGRLTVLRVEPDTRRIDRSTPLLGPTLARRSFTLGDDRIAWVAPADEGADGELHVRTWGDPGEGNLRFRGIRLRDGIPAF